MKQSQQRYQAYLSEREQEWEALCVRCGGCCGAFDDPCINLHKETNGQYRCVVYQARFGKHQTQQGKQFHCIPIREAMHHSWPNEYLCAYKKYRS